jgi:hypothetical protein
MCQFLSLVSNGDGKPLYFDAKLRKQIRKGKLNYEPDSHTSIADYFGFKAEKEDKLNKYEYNPITKAFQIDQKNNPVDDSDKIRVFCENLDFKTVIPKLRLHPIVHPFKDFSVESVSKSDLALLKKWASVWASVRDSVWASVRASVWASVRDSVWDSVGDSVWASVWDSVWASVRASVWDSVRASVGDSVGASVWDSVWDSVWASVWASVGASVRAYTSSFFELREWKYIKHPKGKNPFQPCIDLWNKGIVPSYDGTKWRLHGKNGKIIWEGKIEDIKSKGELK